MLRITRRADVLALADAADRDLDRHQAAVRVARRHLEGAAGLEPDMAVTQGIAAGDIEQRLQRWPMRASRSRPNSSSPALLTSLIRSSRRS